MSIWFATIQTTICSTSNLHLVCSTLQGNKSPDTQIQRPRAAPWPRFLSWNQLPNPPKSWWFTLIHHATSSNKIVRIHRLVGKPFRHGGYPLVIIQLSNDGIFRNKPSSYWGSPMAMETPMWPPKKIRLIHRDLESGIGKSLKLLSGVIIWSTSEKKDMWPLCCPSSKMFGGFMIP